MATDVLLRHRDIVIKGSLVGVMKSWLGRLCVISYSDVLATSKLAWYSREARAVQGFPTS